MSHIRKQIHADIEAKHRRKGTRSVREKIPVQNVRAADASLKEKNRYVSAYGFSKMIPHRPSILSRNELKGLAQMGGFSSVNAAGFSILAGLIDEGIEEAVNTLQHMKMEGSAQGYHGGMLGHPVHVKMFGDLYGKGVNVSETVQQKIKERNLESAKNMKDFLASTKGPDALTKKLSYQMLPSVYKHYYNIIRKAAYGLSSITYKIKYDEDNNLAKMKNLGNTDTPFTNKSISVSENMWAAIGGLQVYQSMAKIQLKGVAEFFGQALHDNSTWKYFSRKDVLSVADLVAFLQSNGDNRAGPLQADFKKLKSYVMNKKKFFGVDKNIGKSSDMTINEFELMLRTKKPTEYNYFSVTVERNIEVDGKIETDTIDEILLAYGLYYGTVP